MLPATESPLQTQFPSVSTGGPLVEGRFESRPNRFLVMARIPPRGEVVEVHLPDPGRLRELLLPGAPLWLRPVPAESSRRTRWTAVLVQAPDGGELVSLDTGLPNRLVGRALEAGLLPEFAGWTLARREVPLGRSRIDFLLEDQGETLALEVKSVTLLEEGVARFPDAVTERGARHVDELRRYVETGRGRAAVLFLLQRASGSVIEAAEGIDPRFAKALARAAESGVQVMGRRCGVTVEGVALGGTVPVRTGRRSA